MEHFAFPPKYIIPSLDEIIQPQYTLCNCGPYNRSAFVAYLARYHCMENLDFIVELDRFLASIAKIDTSSPQNTNESTASLRHRDNVAHHWCIIYNVFLEQDAIKEVNVPCCLRSPLSPDTLPHPSEVMKMRSVIYDLLLDRYNDFVVSVRASCTGSARRRRLECVPPEYGSVNTSAPATIPGSFAYFPTSPQLAPPVSVQLFLPPPPSSASHHDSRNHSSASDTNTDISASREGSQGTLSTTRSSSRGSLIASFVDSGFKKAVKKFRLRRALDLEEYRV